MERSERGSRRWTHHGLALGLVAFVGAQVAAVHPAAAGLTSLVEKASQRGRMVALGSKKLILPKVTGKIPLLALFVCYPRSGSLYTAEVLNFAGLRAMHEDVFLGTKRGRSEQSIRRSLVESSVGLLVNAGLSKPLGYAGVLPELKTLGKLLPVEQTKALARKMVSEGCNVLVSWAATVPHPQYDPPVGPSRDILQPKWVFHQVRHPLDVFSSAKSTLSDDTTAFIHAHTTATKYDPSQALHRTARGWLDWNHMAGHDADVRVRVETLDKIWHKLIVKPVSQLTGPLGSVEEVFHSKDSPLRGVNSRSHNSSYHKLSSWAQFRRELLIERKQLVMQRRESKQLPRERFAAELKKELVDADRLYRETLHRAAQYGYRDALAVIGTPTLAKVAKDELVRLFFGE